jgi:hypothetical protein
MLPADGSLYPHESRWEPMWVTELPPAGRGMAHLRTSAPEAKADRWYPLGICLTFGAGETHF